MKVLTRGYYGFGNLGDDVLLSIVYKWLNQNFKLDIEVFSNYSPNLKSYSEANPFYNQYIYDFLNEKPYIRDWTHKSSYDLIIQGGGGVHFDHSTGGYHNFALNKLLLKLGCKSVNNYENLVRAIVNKPPHLTSNYKIGLGIGIGDFKLSGRRFKSHLSAIGGYDFLWIRDSLSEKWLNKMKYKGTLVKSTDLAFAYKYWMPQNIPKQITDSVGIVLLSKDTLNENFYNQQIEVIKLLKKEGFSVKVYFFEEKVDYSLFTKFKNLVELKIWQPSKNNLEDYLLDLASNSILISGRAHGTILGACMGIPSISIETSSKLREVASMLPNSSFLLPKNALKYEYLTLIKKITNDRSNIYQRLQKDVASNSLLADHGFKEAAKFINNIKKQNE